MLIITNNYRKINIVSVIIVKNQTFIIPAYPNAIPAAADKAIINIGLSFLYNNRNKDTANMPKET